VLATPGRAGTIGVERPRIGLEPFQAPGKDEEMATYTAYCVKCREKREFEGEEITMPNGRRAAQGICPVCGTKVFRILGKAS
jgi:Domain of unknown function (DUF5679)